MNSELFLMFYKMFKNSLLFSIKPSICSLLLSLYTKNIIFIFTFIFFKKFLFYINKIYIFLLDLNFSSV